MRPVVIAALALALTACAKADNEPGPGNVSVGEARTLDEAAQMLEDQRLPAGAVPPPALPAASPAASPAPSASSAAQGR